MTKIQLFFILDKDPEIYRSFYEQDPRYASINRLTYSYNDYLIILIISLTLIINSLLL